MKKTIQLITNNLLTYESLCRAFQTANRELVLSVNAQEGTQHYAVAVPDLLLVDLDWPFDGQGDPEVVKQALDICPSLPVIVISGRQDLVAAVETLGVTAVAEKPLDVAALLLLADELIDGRSYGTGNGQTNGPVCCRHLPPSLEAFREALW